jgi:hypothetical protein
MDDERQALELYLVAVRRDATGDPDALIDRIVATPGVVVQSRSAGRARILAAPNVADELQRAHETEVFVEPVMERTTTRLDRSRKPDPKG